MAVTSREQQMIDAYDAGLSPGQIAAQLGLTFKYVKDKIASLHGGGALRNIAAMERGSKLLRDAILRERGLS